MQKIISACGIASRREAETMIAAGRVKVNGTAARLGASADPGKDIIEVDGKPISQREQNVYIMLNKPRGYLTTVRDDRGRKTVMELVSVPGVKVYPAGRLDYNSEGLLILTNDGDFANAVMHPSSGKKKTYEVQVRGDIPAAARLLREPMDIDGHTAKADSVKVIQDKGGRGVLHITIQEGRNRQIRKMCQAAGLHILSLRRISIGTLKLGTLPSGKWRRLTPDEVESICNAGELI